MRLAEEAGRLETHSPWPTLYTHRLCVNLGRLADDIDASAQRYAEAVVESKGLQRDFMTCMEYLDPRA
jgi:hypothetical protein